MAQPPPAALLDQSPLVTYEDAGSAGVRSAKPKPDPREERQLFARNELKCTIVSSGLRRPGLKSVPSV